MIRLSDIDTRRFGIVCARADDVATNELDAIDAFCRNNKVKFLTARCNINDIHVAQQLEARGYRLMDTLIYYRYDCTRKTPVPPLEQNFYVIREHKPGEENAVRDMAAQIFHDYAHGHYHTDPALDRNCANEVYPDWAYNSCLSREVADTVLVAESGNQLVGFLTFKTKGEIILNGVIPSFQKKGIYPDLLNHALNSMRQQGAACVLISTQLTNFPSQKACVKVGFEPAHAMYTFHKWY